MDVKRRALAALMTLALIASCGDDDPQAPPGGDNGGGGGDPCVGGPTTSSGATGTLGSVSYHLVNAMPGVTFESIVGIENAGDGSGRLFIVEQRGRIVVVDSARTTDTSKEFLNIVVTCCGERGLLGLAFHPDYETNGYFYVYYSPSTLNRTRLSRFTVSGDPDAADPASEKIMLEISQPFTNHNGGGLAFGEGTELFIGVGDGGSGGDPQGHAQNPRTLLGNILRIDVGINEGTDPYYGIPGDNPYKGNTDGFAEEIYALGIRNPWRISYDHTDMRLWVGDVGQGNWEEVDIVELGRNYGWNCREGAHNYVPPSPACTLSASGYVNPVWEYFHDGASASITGGYIYRGPNTPGLTGQYVYADYNVNSEVWALTWDGTSASNVKLLDATFPISTFGVGEDGELYIADYSRFAGSARGIYRLVETPIVAEP
jgi:glucose/arabinose dehydrogenase